LGGGQTTIDITGLTLNVRDELHQIVPTGCVLDLFGVLNGLPQRFSGRGPITRLDLDQRQAYQEVSSP
jgi:hypothetical protein